MDPILIRVHVRGQEKLGVSCTGAEGEDDLF